MASDDAAPLAPADSSGPPPLSIVVKTLTGQQLQVELPGGDEHKHTVADVKQRLEDTNDIPVRFQRLIFRGHELRDEELLTALHIEQGSVVHLVLKREHSQAHMPAQQQQQQQQQGGVPVMGQFPQFQFAQAPAANFQQGAAAVAAGAGPVNHDRVRMAHKLGSAVRIFAFIDGLFVLLLAFSYPPLFLGCALCACGYYGAQKFLPQYLACYLVFIVASIALRIYLMMNESDQSSLVVILALGVVIECFIFNVAFRFFQIVRALTPEERGFALIFGNVVVGRGLGIV